MGKLRIALGVCAVAVAAFAASAGGAPVATTAAGGSGSPGKNGGAAGHERPLPKFVQKWQNERLLAADLVARGKATPNADGVVELPNGRFVKHRLEDT